jgi:hypothetical protein
MTTPDRNSQNINFGPCDVLYGGVYLGLTKGGTVAEFETTVHETTTDQLGPNAPVALWHTGDTIKVTCNMLETTVAKLAAAGVLTTMTNSPADRLTAGKSIGNKLQGKRLVCVPTRDGDPALVVYAAAVYGKIQWKYGADAEKEIPLTFIGMQDFTRTDGDRLFRIGGTAS